MKKKLILIAFTFISLILITGCGEKKNDRVTIMNDLIGTWEYQVNTTNKTVLKLKTIYSFDNNYNFTYKTVALLKNGKEMKMNDATGTYELDMDAKKIKLTFDDEKKDKDIIKELSYKYDNNKFLLNPNKDGKETYQKK